MLFGLGAAAAASIYLAARIWRYHCQITAWIGLLWIGCEALNALLGITAESFVVLLILLFTSFQGVRGCSVTPDARFDEAGNETKQGK